MIIVHVLDYFQPQLGYQEAFLAKKQAEMGHEVYVVTSDRYAGALYRGASRHKVLGPRIKKLGFVMTDGFGIWSLKSSFEVRTYGVWMSGLEEKIRELKPDIVNVHVISTITAIRIARLKKKQPDFALIYDDHSTLNINLKMKLLCFLLRPNLFQLVFRAADSLIAASEETRLAMNQRYGFPLESIPVIPLGADDKLFRFDPEARRQTRQQLGIKDDEVVFIYTGKITPDKGVHLLVQATIELARKYPNVKVVIVGDGPPAYINSVKQRAKSEKLGHSFVWPGWVSNRELHRFYSAADVAVWPSSVTISTLEAMACQLPVIVSDYPGASERVRYNNGFICEEGNLGQLTQHMERLLQDKDLRRRMGLNGRRAIEKELNWDMIARKFINIYERSLST